MPTSSDADQSLRFSPEKIELWWVRMSVFFREIKHFSTMLSADERARAGAFRFPVHQQRFVVGRAVLRHLLGDYLGVPAQSIRFSYSETGKPQLADPPNSSWLSFNLAHSDDVAVFAFSRKAMLGVDVERLRPVREMSALSARFFTEDEHRKIQSLGPERELIGFFNAWTRKEAFLKATGDGLGRPLREVEVSLLPDDPPRIHRIGGSVAEATRFHLDVFQLEDEFVGAVVREGLPVPVSLQRWTLAPS